MVYIINATPVAPQLQPCPNDDEFFTAIEKLEQREKTKQGPLTALAQIISEPLHRTNAPDTVDPYAGDDATLQPATPDQRRGPKLKAPWPFVKLRLWCLYRNTGAPRKLGTLYSQRLKKPGDPLAARCGFKPKHLPDRKTIRERFLKLDEQPELIETALRAISAVFTQHYLLPPPLPEYSLEAGKGTRKNRTAEKNAHADRLVREALGPEEYNELFDTQWKRERFLLDWLHGGDLRCHLCITGQKECFPCAGDRVYEIQTRQPECPNPDNHARHGTHESRRQWRCQCCRSRLSVTSGTLLHGVKLPLRTVIRCIHHLVDERYGITVGEMSRKLNRRGKDGRRGSAHMMLHRIREAMDEEHAPFEGTTEIDEAQIKLPEGVIHLLGAFNVDTGRVRIEIIPKEADRAIMADFILRVTAPGSRIDTDGTAAWPPWILDRQHHTVIHSAYDYAHREEITGPDGKQKTIYVTTLHIEGSWGFLKRALRIPLTVSHKHFPRYLSEAQWRINRLHNRKEAEAYNGEERRNYVLMGQIVANMPHRWTTVQEIREGKRARTEPQPPRCMTPIDHDLPEDVEMPRAA